MERDWPEGRGIFHNADKTFLVWVNEEDQLRIISMQKGGDVKGVFERLARGIKAVGDSVKAESGKDFQISPKFGYIHSCPTNLGTGMRASVHVDLPGWTKDSIDALKARCDGMGLQPRGTRGESGGQTGKFQKYSTCQSFAYICFLLDAPDLYSYYFFKLQTWFFKHFNFCFCKASVQTALKKA